MLQETIKHLKEICRKENLDVSSDCLFENAVKIVISHNIDKSKKENIQSYQKSNIIQPRTPSKEIDKQKTILATDKQRNLMTKLKIPFTKNTTIKEAKELIETKLGKTGKYPEY